MAFIIGIGFIFAGAFVVCTPLLWGASSDAAPGPLDDAAERWDKQKRDAYAAIKEAQFDLQMGKLSRADYDAIRTVQEARAIEALKATEGGGTKRKRE